MTPEQDAAASEITDQAQPFTFADLFAGIGGFHAALHAAGGKASFASEIDEPASRVYEHNWGLRPEGDIVPLTDPVVKVPPVDVLAGGFPCQPFSKSGFQRGLEDVRGTLFFNICKVLAEPSPPAVILLENVRNLAGPRQRDTWDRIIDTLRDLGYQVSGTPAVMSPHLLPPWLGGRPQVRERVFIVGTYVGPHLSRTPEAVAVPPIADNRPVDGWDPHKWDLDDHLLQPDWEIENLADYRLSDEDQAAIQTWQNFLDEVLPTGKLPGFPIWADHFRYPAVIPEGTPAWKGTFLLKNAELYRDHKAEIDAWRGGPSPDKAPRLAHLNPSRRKLEWQAGPDPEPEDRSLWRTVLHFRPSGIRAKRPSYLPALVAITQTSIVGARRRRITPVEAQRLQGLPEWWEWTQAERPGKPGRAQGDAASYKQLGNGVNAGVAYWVLREHVRRDAPLIRKVAPHLVDAVLAAPANPDDRLALKHRHDRRRALPVMPLPVLDGPEPVPAPA